MDIERSNGDDDNDEDEEEVVVGGGVDVESSTLTLPMNDEDVVVVSLCFKANFVKGSFAVVVVVAADAMAVGLLVK